MLPEIEVPRAGARGRGEPADGVARGGIDDKDATVVAEGGEALPSATVPVLSVPIVALDEVAVRVVDLHAGIQCWRK